ncbi:nitrogenase-stabilizing/protective protein NifW [Parathalassolituus penaei]|uniref:Nitrogenase-stabilizing/protective protein NifW n=1 Tax=Parathalassolituus penaei TaxID=2997323 RepID=A0A9X3EF69_9GAMM|nr:nitrogenase-stabilizing/protective protein NifW [Parathalassolituus penaei]MCY0965644.1 nitrogenase-stabilizing/protective protein NifW [Parathalassolituus penaei]
MEMSLDMVRDESMALEDALDELESAEDFLDYFGIPFDPRVVQINRLHIMQRYHDYLTKSASSLQQHQEDEPALRAVYQVLLERAYQDFVDSDALTEKVFKVFRMHEPQTSFVSIDSLLGP